MTALLLRASGRFYWRHPWQLALAITGIALGVAVYVGVDLANDSARRAFELSTDLLRGQTTHRLLPIGGPLSEDVFVALVNQQASAQAAPVVEVELRIDGPSGARYTLLGIDPLKELGFRDYSSYIPGRGSNWARLISEPNTVLVPGELAAERGLDVGSALRVWLAGREVNVRVVGVLRDDATALQAAPPIVADISTAQELASATGVLTRIDLRLDAAQAEYWSANLPPNTTLVQAGNERASLDEMMQAFRINLTALGLLALVVGMFLIYSTMSFSIVQRKPMIGVLRAIGVDSRQVLTSVLFEAFWLGLLGTGLGLVLGHWLAASLVDMVLRTIGDLYFNRALQQAEPSTLIDVRGAALGIGATLIAALAPALDAARGGDMRALQRSSLEATTRRRCRSLALLALPTLLVAGLLLLSSEGLLLAFVAMFMALCAGAMLTPLGTLSLMRIVQPLAAKLFGLAGSMAVRGVSASLSRTGVAVAALAIAVATVIGVGLMIQSFRASLVSWLDTTLTADLYVSFGPDLLTEESLSLDELLQLSAVAGVSLARSTRLPTSLGELGLRAAAPGPEGYGLDVVAGSIDIMQAQSDAVAMSEPLAYRLGLGAGDALVLPTPMGPEPFQIAAVYRDYSSFGNDLLMPLKTYRSRWGDQRLSGLGIHLVPEADRSAAIAAVGRVLGVKSNQIRSTEVIETLSLAVFDRTFEITEVLRLLAGLVAFLGVLSAVLAIQLERARERAILRGLGFSPRGLASLVLVQTGLLGISASLAAMPIGTLLAALLVQVINRRSFGWSMELSITPEPLWLGAGLAIGASLLAGAYPAWLASRTDLGAALRDE